MTPYRVRLFARYAEVLGGDTITVTLADGATVADVLTALRQRRGGETLPSHPLVAVNLKQVALTTELHQGDEVALLPPLAGG